MWKGFQHTGWILFIVVSIMAIVGAIFLGGYYFQRGYEAGLNKQISNKQVVNETTETADQNDKSIRGMISLVNNASQRIVIESAPGTEHVVLVTPETTIQKRVLKPEDKYAAEYAQYQEQANKYLRSDNQNDEKPTPPEKTTTQAIPFSELTIGNTVTASLDGSTAVSILVISDSGDKAAPNIKENASSPALSAPAPSQ